LEEKELRVKGKSKGGSNQERESQEETRAVLSEKRRKPASGIIIKKSRSSIAPSGKRKGEKTSAKGLADETGPEKGDYMPEPA